MEQRRKARDERQYTAYCNRFQQVEAAMNDERGVWRIKLPTGHRVTFELQGDELVARVTEAQARSLAQFGDLVQVEGFENPHPPKPKPVVKAQNWMEEGERLHREKLGQAQESSPDGAMAKMLQTLLGGDAFAALVAQRAAEIASAKAEEEARSRVERMSKAQEAKRSEMNGEFGVVRLGEHLSDDDVFELVNLHLPDVDPGELSAGARLNRVARAAVNDEALRLELRRRLPEFGGDAE